MYLALDDLQRLICHNHAKIIQVKKCFLAIVLYPYPALLSSMERVIGAIQIRR